MRPFAIRLAFHGRLGFFVQRGIDPAAVERHLKEAASVKDVIEACGVPHPEVDLILVEGEPVDFSYRLKGNAAVEVYGVGSTITFFPENRLQTQNIQRFIADGHLGKLVRDLRLLGIDVVYNPAAEDRQLVALAKTDNRALLTRDRRLLMHASVRHGHYLRSQDPLEQTIEVLCRFDLSSAFAPFTRCLHCNALLEQVEKSEVIEQLEPLTKIYYEQFRRCTGCGQIYWPGSHFDKLLARIEGIRATLKAKHRSEDQT